MLDARVFGMRVAMARPVGLAVATSILLASCTGQSTVDSTRVKPESTWEPVSTGPRESSLDEDDPRPLLTIGEFAWSVTDIWLPRDVHTVVVYPDGRIIRLSFLDGANMRMFTAKASAGDVGAWMSLTDEAGLDAPGVLPAESSPLQVVDGGYAVVTRRSNDGLARIAVDQACVGGGVGRRDVVCRLLMSMPPLDEAEWTEVVIDRWAIESARPLPSLDSIDWPWPDLDPASLSWDFNDAGVRCVVIDDTDWPYGSSETQDYLSLDEGVFRRPLLPHERSCVDVFDWRSALGYDTNIPLRPDGLSPSA